MESNQKHDHAAGNNLREEQMAIIKSGLKYSYDEYHDLYEDIMKLILNREAEALNRLEDENLGEYYTDLIKNIVKILQNRQYIRFDKITGRTTYTYGGYSCPQICHDIMVLVKKFGHSVGIPPYYGAEYIGDQLREIVKTSFRMIRKKNRDRLIQIYT